MSFCASLFSGDVEKTWCSSNLYVPSKRNSVFDAASMDPTHYFMPLRKVDCATLNRWREGEDTSILVEFTRATADVKLGLLRYNFWDQQPKTLAASRWFYTDPNGKRPPQPLDVEDDDAVEEVYQRGLKSGIGPDVSSFERSFKTTYNGGKSYKVVLAEVQEGAVKASSSFPPDPTAQLPPPPPPSSSNKVYTLKMKPIGVQNIFSPDLQLQRGYGEYRVEGEAEEVLLASSGPAKEILFVIHGIGELVWSKTEVSFVPSMIEQMAELRTDIQRRQVKDWKKERKAAEEEAKRTHQVADLPPPPKRVEVIPIVWYDCWHTGTDMKKTLDAATIQTIPLVRTIANDIIFDVLMYQQPELRAKILTYVSRSINEIWLGFCSLNSDFRGGVSICGHSLGSVIAWDLLASHAEEERKGASAFIGEGGSKEMGGGAMMTTAGSDLIWGPGRGRVDSGGAYSTLPTSPRCVWLMGSPVGLFLTLRNAHETIAGTTDFNLMGETTKLFNVFNPSDPVAYRIEPLQLPMGKKPVDLPAPAYVPSADYSFGAIGGVRAHLKVKQHIDAAQKNATKAIKVAEKMFSKLTDQMGVGGARRKSGGGGGGAPSPDLRGPRAEEDEGEEEDGLDFSLTGHGNKRLDWQVQTGVLDSELISTITAHTSYFNNADVVAFMARN
mmetsp:Transcript_19522/g.39026  ORF Transcript_19522/g.39026 Transcript_19522/m.39026 type:complete len:667 (+) Transcript_19522:141-2141(+)